METKSATNYKKVLQLIHQLPDDEIEKLFAALQTEIETKKTPTTMHELILQAPTWTDEELQIYRSARKHINKSRIA